MSSSRSTTLELGAQLPHQEAIGAASYHNLNDGSDVEDVSLDDFGKPRRDYEPSFC